MGTDRDNGIGLHQRAAVQRYPMEAQKLPDVGEEWRRIEIGLDQAALTTFHRNGVVERVRRDPQQVKRSIWQTKKGVTGWVEEHTSEPTTPCGHATGIHTIEPGTYTCTDDDCDCRMDRETAMEVVA